MSNDRNEVVLNVYGVMGRQEIVRGGIVEHPILDADGSQTDITTSTGRWLVEYNGENRPVMWTRVASNSSTPNSVTPTLIPMSYDRMGRRVRSCDETFVYDGYLNIGSTIWDPTEPVATRSLVWLNGNALSYYFHDGNKNVADILGAEICHYEYTPFCKKASHSVEANPWQFASEWTDEFLSLVYYNYRSYNPFIGRWIARDRISETGGLNLYVMAENNPILQSDCRGDNIVALIVMAALAEIAGHYACDWYAESGLLDETDAYKHCMVSCRYSNCSSIINGKIAAAILTIIGGIIHEVISDGNTWEGAIDDIKSNLIGIIGSLIPGQSCEDACECEKGRWNR